MISLIGVAGPSGAGKSTVTKLIAAGSKNILRIKLDNYFNDIEGFPKVYGESNWDVPGNLNFDLLFTNLCDLKKGVSTKISLFDKVTFERMYRTVTPKPIILVEGFLLYFDERIRDLFDKKIYLDIPESEQIKRRIKREAPDRNKYIREVVIPNYRKYGVPTRKYADIVLDGNQKPERLRDEIVRFLDIPSSINRTSHYCMEEIVRNDEER